MAVFCAMDVFHYFPGVVNPEHLDHFCADELEAELTIRHDFRQKQIGDDWPVLRDVPLSFQRQASTIRSRPPRVQIPCHRTEKRGVLPNFALLDVEDAVKLRSPRGGECRKLHGEIRSVLARCARVSWMTGPA